MTEDQLREMAEVVVTTSAIATELSAIVGLLIEQLGTPGASSRAERLEAIARDAVAAREKLRAKLGLPPEH